MIIVNPYIGNHGRLGNQLFQIASTIGLGWRLNCPVILPEDWAYRPFFSVPDEYFGDASAGEGRVDVIELPEVEHIDPAARVYLQDLSLFSVIEEQIREMFKPSELARQEFQKPEYDQFTDILHRGFVLSVHVRRGDNVPGQDPGVADKHNYHPLRPMSYYEQAIEMFPKDSTLVVFSDEPDWCEKHFPQAAYVHHGVTRPKEHEPEFATAPVLDWIDLMMMTWCDFHVLSNSTYSWWGAWLSIDQAPVYPWPFFGPKLQYIDASLMFPDNWRRLEHE